MAVRAWIRFPLHVRAGSILRALGVSVCLLSSVACDLLSGTGDQAWARVESTGFVLVPGESSPAGLIVARPDIGFAGGLGRMPQHAGDATWQINDTSIVTASRPMNTVLARRPGRTVLRGRSGNLSDTATATVVTDSGAVRLTAQAVFAGGTFSCAVRVDQRILCWGSSWYGELGNGVARKFTGTLSPVPVVSSQLLHDVQLGWTHACALDTSARAWCWGGNHAGQVRAAQIDIFPQPVLVANGKTFSSIAPGGSMTCGLSKGEAFCWGSRFNGIELLSTTHPLTSLRAGTLHLCAVDETSHAWCAGDNRFGQLGAGSSAYSRVLLAVDPGTTYVDVVPGSNHTCGLTTTGAVRCWGAGDNGELGTGDRRSSPVPVDVPLPERASLISTGVQTSCALLASQRVYCWGYNGSGSIGVRLPPTNPSSDDLVFASPEPIASAVRFKQVSAGRPEATCAISVSDVVYCWGNNLSGAVGAGRHETRQLWTQHSHFWLPTLVRSVVP